MKRVVWFGWIILALAGCQSGDALIPEPEPATDHAKVDSVAKPVSFSATEIALVIVKNPITVGYSSEGAFQLFHDRDSSKSGFEKVDLPPKFQFPYRALTWESGHSGFGEITYNSVLVFAMYQEDVSALYKGDKAQDRVDQLVKDHKDQLNGKAPDEVKGEKGGRIHYYFWDEDNQRLMICSYQNAQDETMVTVAMGDDVVMDALDMSKQKAERAQILVDNAYFKVAGRRPANPAVAH